MSLAMCLLSWLAVAEIVFLICIGEKKIHPHKSFRLSRVAHSLPVSNELRATEQRLQSAIRRLGI